MKRSTKIALLVAFCVVGWLQQRYVKWADQAEYEAWCAEVAATPNHPASPCVSKKRPDIPLPARG